MIEKHIRYYKGIKMGADENLHNKVFEEFKLLENDKNTSILILGSGHGAYEQRLIDHGYTNIKSVDIKDYRDSKENSRNITLRDLNKDFDDIGKYDYIFAIEIIEHLENQFHFIRNVSKLMHTDTVLFVTTPNISRKSLRLRYLLTNDFEFFTERDLIGSGHINLISDCVFKHNLDKSNLRIFKETYNRDYFSKNDFRANAWRFKIFYLIYKLTSNFISGTDGVEKIYIIKNYINEKNSF